MKDVSNMVVKRKMNVQQLEQCINGIEYRITSCDNVEMFADRGLYLAVVDGVPSADSYQYDEKTGEITRNESYDGINALFNLPIDKSKADTEAAEKYLEEMEKEESSADDMYDMQVSTNEIDALMDKVSQWDVKTLKKNAELLENLTQVLTPDKDGKITISEFKIGNGVEVGEEEYSVKDYLEGRKVGETIIGNIMADEEEIYIESLTLNEDGTVTMNVYHYSGKE